MNIDYENCKSAFNNYVNECKDKIINSTFSDVYLTSFKSLRNELINLGKLDECNSISDAIKYERLEMINTKVNHTFRVVNDSSEVSKKINTPVSFNEVLKVSSLLHDIGRFDQATWNNSFNDSCYTGKDVKNHAQAGYKILFCDGRINDYNIDKRLYKAVGSVVYNHGNPILTGDLTIRFNDVNDLDIDKLNSNEKVVTSSLVQMVRDVDMLDIFYQHFTGEISVVKDYINYKICNDTIFDIASKFDIKVSDILNYNLITLNDFEKMTTIKIPVNLIDLEKMSVPIDIKEKFFNNQNIDLREIMSRQDWTYITGMWWRLNHFLNNITFTSNLELIKEKNLLDRIYNLYPDKFKFLVKDAFSYSKEFLVEQVLSECNDKIYVKKYMQKM